MLIDACFPLDLAHNCLGIRTFHARQNVGPCDLYLRVCVCAFKYA